LAKASAMIRYHISYGNPLSHFIKVEMKFSAKNGDSVVKLPSWRPGRYQIQNFAKNLKNLRAFDEKGPLVVEKSSKDSWLIYGTRGEITISYEYYAFKMDAGSSWLDEEQLYLNFINFALYVEDGMEQSHQVNLSIPDDYKVATGLTKVTDRQFVCGSYYELVDSPLMASASLRRVQYEVQQHVFNIWIQGSLAKTDEELIADFKPFTALQMEVMGGFPCPEYHFLVQCLPYKHYHGVEHLNSTVITIGPSEAIESGNLYYEFLGVSSHELFHTWNVIRLRPAEMSPYDFSGENYHTTGFVTEGVTTYYGDLFLARSGVFSQEEYLAEVNKLLKRHYSNEGRKHYSVAESSYDLWLDGYEKGIPGRKVSIYNEGALAAMILDLKIRLKTDHDKSLDDVMRLMWQWHQQKPGGYTYEDYKRAAESIYSDGLDDYFEQIINGVTPFETELEPLLEEFGLSFELVSPEKREERDFGIRLLSHNNRHIIEDIASGSDAKSKLSRLDEVLSVNGVGFDGKWPETTDTVNLTINRFGRKVELSLEKGSEPYFEVYQITVNAVADEEQKQRLSNWLEA